MNPRFFDAYDAGSLSAINIMWPEGSTEDIGIHWRIVTLCSAATHAACGINTGIMSGAACKYLDFNKTGKSFWLFDTFEGIPVDQISETVRAAGRSDENVFYTDVRKHTHGAGLLETCHCCRGLQD